jgi:hypothetical protein
MVRRRMIGTYRQFAGEEPILQSSIGTTSEQA